MKRLLCFFGMHEWHAGYDFPESLLLCGTIHQYCARCGKKGTLHVKETA